jgi:hypothetical protein
MSTPRFFTDEDVYGAVATVLQKATFDAVSTSDTGRLGASDESPLEWAAGGRWTLVTFNVPHFAALHDQWIRDGKHHAGIIVSNQLPIGELLRRLLHLARNVDGDALADRSEFLSDW